MEKVREIVFPRYRGVYLLGHVKHQWLKAEKLWVCVPACYVGQSRDMALRLLGHRTDRGAALVGGDDPRMVLLDSRRCWEMRFIAAAIRLKLPLVNKQVPKPRLIEKWDLTEEINALREALIILDTAPPSRPWRSTWPWHRNCAARFLPETLAIAA